jgi:glycosyltransferase involved in cell wall biosynthesis
MSEDVLDWLIVGRSNGYGLSHDLAIIADAIAATGSTVALAGPWRRSPLDFLLRKKRARRILHVERAFPLWFSAGDENWLLPNQERFPQRHLGRLQRIDRVLAKTHHAETVFSALSRNVDYLGFTSNDRFDQAEVKNWSRFFHVAGGSTLKGTEDVLALWAAHPEWPELVLVQKAANAPEVVPPNVRLISEFLPDAELKRLQNNCGIHLCPSRAEGWGHTILEAMSVEALILTTDAAPMNEHVTTATGLLVAAGRSEPRHLGVCHYVDRGALETAIEQALAMSQSEKAQLGMAARQRFLSITDKFRAQMQVLFGRKTDAQPARNSGGESGLLTVGRRAHG